MISRVITAAAVSGCAWQSEVQKIGQDTYQRGERALSGLLLTLSPHIPRPPPARGAAALSPFFLNPKSRVCRLTH